MKIIQKLFSQPKAESEKSLESAEVMIDEPQTSASNPIVETAVAGKPASLLELPPGVHSGKLSDVGRERERNEDTICVVETYLHHDLGAEPFGIFIVADGMGGHQKGEVASSLAARTVAHSILKNVYLPYLVNDSNANQQPLKEALVAAVEQANSAVVSSVPDGGTTLIVALVMGSTAYIAHVGDSRAYILKKETFSQITVDHSLAHRLEELGQATPEEVSQVQNVLYRAIGQGDTVEVDTYMQHLPAGSSLLLCSDGLWGLVPDAEIQNILRSASNPQSACKMLVAKANENGGKDNISTIIVSMGIDD